MPIMNVVCCLSFDEIKIIITEFGAMCYNKGYSVHEKETLLKFFYTVIHLN